ncbi:uncharacterized protein LOC135078470 [Ostrinia nubilalis]|uniref:uncharacterized protein LOC135078470 n=1 Tax=Ostrinia nubilalis TaxID=29057 RepID=UPI00308264CF
MAFLRNKLTLLVLCAVLAAAASQVSQGGPHQPQGGSHTSQGGPHENQGRVRRQAEDDEWSPPTWTTCDITTTPVISCHDCSTRLICKPVGGILKPCLNPLKPHCNNGICSAVPAAGC